MLSVTPVVCKRPSAVLPASKGKAVLSSSFASVMAFSAISFFNPSVFSFSLMASPSRGSGFQFANPVLYFACKTFLTCSSICDQPSTPSAMAPLIFEIVFSTSPGRQRISFPAIKDSTLEAWSGKASATPFISNASVKVMPLKPISSFKSFVTLFLDTDATLLVLLSMAGMNRCPIIALPIPASNIF